MYFFLCASVLFLTTLVNLSAQNELIAEPHKSDKAYLYQFQGKITISMSGMHLIAQFSAKLAGEDSASISFYGPMGVILGKVFANKDTFMFLDVINNWVVTGIPTRKNIYKCSQIPLNFIEFVRLFRGELPIPIDSLTQQEIENNPEKALYRKITSQFVDFYLVNTKTNKLHQFQKKLLDGRLLLTLIYPEYWENDGTLFPKKYQMQAPDRNGIVTLEIEKMNRVEEFTHPFSFDIPKTVEIYEYNETNEVE